MAPTQAQQYGPVSRERLTLCKDDLRELAISDDMYAQLKAIPEAEQTIKEFVLVRVFDLLRTQHLKHEVWRTDNISLRYGCTHTHAHECTYTRTYTHVYSCIHHQSGQHIHTY